MNPSTEGPVIVVIACGGTIDKRYSIRTAELVVAAPYVTDVAHVLRTTVPYSVVSLVRKDSLQMTSDDRERVASFIASSMHSRFVVTHGTDSLVESARSIGDDDRINPLTTVVLTGAFVPGALSPEEACFNLGAAFTAVTILPPGVYVAVGGEVHPAKAVEKNHELRKFSSNRGIRHDTGNAPRVARGPGATPAFPP